MDVPANSAVSPSHRTPSSTVRGPPSTIRWKFAERGPIHADFDPFSTNDNANHVSLLVSNPTAANESPNRPLEPTHAALDPSVNDRTLEPILELNESLTQPISPHHMELCVETGLGMATVLQDAQNDVDMETTEILRNAPPSNNKLNNMQTGMRSPFSSELTLSSVPPLDTPPASPEPSGAHVDPTTESSGKPPEGWTADDWPTGTWDAWGVLASNTEPTAHIQDTSAYDEDSWYPDGRPSRTYTQQTSADAMRRTLSRLTAHILPLTAVRFGSRLSYRTNGRLREAIPHATFKKLFRDFGTYKNLADSICVTRDNQRKVPNQWQTHIPHLWCIR